MFPRPGWFAIVFLLGSVTPVVAQVASHVTLEQILSNQSVWGKDFPTALADVTAWRAVGEHKVVILENSVQEIAPKVNWGEAEIQSREDKFESVMRSTWKDTHEDLRALTKCDRPGTRLECIEDAQIRTQSVQAVRRGNAIQFATSSKHLEFLSPEATAEIVKKEFGQPERVTTEVIRSDYERRPLILTKYEYVSGKVAFVTSNMSPNRRIERVYLDADAVSTSILGAAKRGR
jgi:hypothetical protein